MVLMRWAGASVLTDLSRFARLRAELPGRSRGCCGLLRTRGRLVGPRGCGRVMRYHLAITSGRSMRSPVQVIVRCGRRRNVDHAPRAAAASPCECAPITAEDVADRAAMATRSPRQPSEQPPAPQRRSMVHSRPRRHNGCATIFGHRLDGLASGPALRRSVRDRVAFYDLQRRGHGQALARG